MNVLIACEESQRVCIEFRKLGHNAFSCDTQAIQPYQFGHPYSKRTCLWLKGLPELVPTDIIDHHEPYVNGGCKDAHGNYRRFQGRKERDPKTRSKTFPGIAKAMSEQWSEVLK